MKVSSPENVGYFGTQIQLDSSFVTKLRKIEQCIIEKNFIFGLDIVRQIIEDYPKTKKPELNTVETINFGELHIKKKIGKVLLNKKVVDLSANEFSLLMMLVEKPNEIIYREKLHKSLLKTDYDGLNRSIDNTVSRLRKKLGDENISQLKIKSIRGKGYLFSSDNW